MLVFASLSNTRGVLMYPLRKRSGVEHATFDFSRVPFAQAQAASRSNKCKSWIGYGISRNITIIIAYMHSIGRLSTPPGFALTR